MRTVIFLIFIFVVALIETGVSGYISISGVAPDLLLIASVTAGLYYNQRTAIIMGILSGMLKDSLGIYSFGMHIFIFPVFAYLTYQFSRRLSIETGRYNAVYIFIVTLIKALLVKFWMSVPGVYISWAVFSKVALLESLYTAVAAYVCIRVIRPFIKSPFGSNIPPNFSVFPLHRGD